MEALERLLIERECERLVTAYCHYVDHGEAARIADLFTEDGVWTSPEFTLKGREELARGFGRRQAQTARMSRHVCNNFRVDVLDADRAEGVVYLTLYRHDGEEGRSVSPLEQPEMVGEYRDRFVRTPDGWRISQREIEVSFLRTPPAS
jgi:ketosteroid isomerase-like protein